MALRFLSIINRHGHWTTAISKHEQITRGSVGQGRNRQFATRGPPSRGAAIRQALASGHGGLTRSKGHHGIRGFPRQINKSFQQIHRRGQGSGPRGDILGSSNDIGPVGPGPFSRNGRVLLHGQTVPFPLIATTAIEFFLHG